MRLKKIVDRILRIGYIHRMKFMKENYAETSYNCGSKIEGDDAVGHMHTISVLVYFFFFTTTQRKHVLPKRTEYLVFDHWIR